LTSTAMLLAATTHSKSAIIQFLSYHNTQLLVQGMGLWSLACWDYRF